MTLQSELLDAMNVERIRAGVPLLGPHGTLNKAAQSHAEEMASTGNFSHYGVGGSDWMERVHRAGPYPAVAIAENIALGQQSPEDCVDSWMSSTGHRRSLLSAIYKSAGCGTARGTKGTYWCALFGTAAPSDSTAPPPTPPPAPPKTTWWQRLLDLILKGRR